ncbi:hypothetical protein WJX84_007478 [Apatococcus fuscideae]|uniref:F-box domain-containing protein n=1 Tax=Apatococcus fuscideae TaxID=2026836 RepID=A0AAW1TAU6_9CHLO
MILLLVVPEWSAFDPNCLLTLSLVCSDFRKCVHSKDIVNAAVFWDRPHPLTKSAHKAFEQWCSARDSTHLAVNLSLRSSSKYSSSSAGSRSASIPVSGMIGWARSSKAASARWRPISA